jgi:hypothetical protein
MKTTIKDIVTVQPLRHQDTKNKSTFFVRSFDLCLRVFVAKYLGAVFVSSDAPIINYSKKKTVELN